MTRHYRLDAQSGHAAVVLKADQGPDPWNGGELLPGMFAPVIMVSQRTGRRVIRPVVWGYPAPGPGGVAVSGEVRWVPTVRNLESPFWIGNLRHRELRCLVPATAFMLRGLGKENWFAAADMPICAMAGIWRDLTDMPVFAILSTDATGEPRTRGASTMPLLLDAVQQDHWLNADWKEAKELVVPYAGALISCA
ncbi:MAG: SOS response-associated peptidase family protein [Sphingorhabdus sp.]